MIVSFAEMLPRHVLLSFPHRVDAWTLQRGDGDNDAFDLLHSPSIPHHMNHDHGGMDHGGHGGMDHGGGDMDMGGMCSMNMLWFVLRPHDQRALWLTSSLLLPRRQR